MYSYFLANMLALILIHLAIGFLTTALRENSKSQLATSIIFMSLTIFTHPWTFTQYYASITLLTIKEILEKIRSEVKIKSNKNANNIPNNNRNHKHLKGKSNRRTEGIRAAETVTNQPILNNLLNFWHNNIFAFKLLYGGYLSNIPIITLALIGTYKLKPKI